MNTRKTDLDPDPYIQFGNWYSAAQQLPRDEPTAMTLATADRDGRPSARIVLLKEFDHNGFVYYTNYHSRKGRELHDNPYAALCFWWGEVQRQIRIEGRVEKVDRQTSDAYFASRPRGSQIGAAASPQSEIVDGLETLQARYQQASQQSGGQAVARPPHWGGYRLVPDRFEFWQGQENRMHDRFLYRSDQGNWQISRLAP